MQWNIFYQFLEIHKAQTGIFLPVYAAQTAA